MAEKIVIEIEKLAGKTVEDFTKTAADPDGKLTTGSACAAVAALASAYLLRASAMAEKSVAVSPRLEYIQKNAEILRAYMVHLIDEDVKCRGPLRKASLEGDPQVMEAARQPAVAISAEIVNMMGQCLELLEELSAFCPRDAMHYVGESAELALSACRAARLYIVDLADLSTDETYRFVTRRENEITLESYAKTAAAILARVEAAI